MHVLIQIENKELFFSTLLYELADISTVICLPRTRFFVLYRYCGLRRSFFNIRLPRLSQLSTSAFFHAALLFCFKLIIPFFCLNFNN